MHWLINMKTKISNHANTSTHYILCQWWYVASKTGLFDSFALIYIFPFQFPTNFPHLKMFTHAMVSWQKRTISWLGIQYCMLQARGPFSSLEHEIEHQHKWPIFQPSRPLPTISPTITPGTDALTEHATFLSDATFSQASWKWARWESATHPTDC